MAEIWYVELTAKTFKQERTIHETKFEVQWELSCQRICGSLFLGPISLI